MDSNKMGEHHRGLDAQEQKGKGDSHHEEVMEQTIADLQLRVEKLEARSQPVAKGGWRETIGFAKDDDLFRKAMKLGEEWRAKANKKGR
jgi:hypothetical protein